MKNLKHIFFDLDHTLWDYDRSAEETLREIHKNIQLARYDVAPKALIKCFYEVNSSYWHKYNIGEIDREFILANRFQTIFRELKIDRAFSEEASEYFVTKCSTKPYLMPDVEVVLPYLKEKYSLHIITNGFNDVQYNKLNSGKILEYFDVIVTSESANARKPASEIFEFSLKQAGASVDQCLMIGDNPNTDIKGARDFGIKTVFYDPSSKRRTFSDYTIHSHLELLKLF